MLQKIQAQGVSILLIPPSQRGQADITFESVSMTRKDILVAKQ